MRYLGATPPLDLTTRSVMQAISESGSMDAMQAGFYFILITRQLLVYISSNVVSTIIVDHAGIREIIMYFVFLQ